MHSRVGAISILIRHEVANDAVGGVPVVVIFCLRRSAGSSSASGPGIRWTLSPGCPDSLDEFRRRHPSGRDLRPSDTDFRAYEGNPHVGYHPIAMPLVDREEHDGPGLLLMRNVTVEGGADARSLDFLHQAGAVEAACRMIQWRPGRNFAPGAARIARGREAERVTARRHPPGGVAVDAVCDVPFATAFRAFHSDAPMYDAPMYDAPMYHVD